MLANVRRSFKCPRASGNQLSASVEHPSALQNQEVEKATKIRKFNRRCDRTRRYLSSTRTEVQHVRRNKKGRASEILYSKDNNPFGRLNHHSPRSARIYVSVEPIMNPTNRNASSTRKGEARRALRLTCPFIQLPGAVRA